VNVLWGDMSLIGPRRMRLLTTLLEKVLEDYGVPTPRQTRHDGWAQVNGLRGADANR